MSPIDSSYHPLQEARQLREQLASHTRRLAFFLGAGTSMAVGMPGLDSLTQLVSQAISSELKDGYEEMDKAAGENANIEIILDKVRLCCELIGEDKERTYCGLNCDTAVSLERAITRAIYDETSKPAPDGIESHITFAQWLREIERDYPPEIFTTNYDLLLEEGLETDPGVPFFDGFIGSVNPFFIPEAVEADGSRESMPNYPPKSWARLWKIHGSIGWRMGVDRVTGRERIYRTGAPLTNNDEELLIYPARQKYEESRKLPYMAYVDRLRRFVNQGESLLVVLGYSFRDEHLNEVIFQGLRSNVRFNVMAFIYNDETYKYVKSLVAPYRRLSLYGPKTATIGDQEKSWKPVPENPESADWPFWDKEAEQFLLGDFKCFTNFLSKFVSSTPRPTPMPEANESSMASNSQED